MLGRKGTAKRSLVCRSRDLVREWGFRASILQLTRLDLRALFSQTRGSPAVAAVREMQLQGLPMTAEPPNMTH